MIARSFDGEVVQRRLRMLSDLLDRLESLGQTSAARLESDWQHAAVVERLLTRIVELAIKINTHVVTSTGALPPPGLPPIVPGRCDGAPDRAATG